MIYRETEVHAIAVKLDVATERRVPMITDDKRNEIYAIYHRPGTLSYKSTSTQKVLHARARARYHAAGYTNQVMCIETPNAGNLKIRIAKMMPANIGHAHNCDITLLQSSSLEKLISFVRVIEAEKKHVVATV